MIRFQRYVFSLISFVVTIFILSWDYEPVYVFLVAFFLVLLFVILEYTNWLLVKGGFETGDIIVTFCFFITTGSALYTEVFLVLWPELAEWEIGWILLRFGYSFGLGCLLGCFIAHFLWGRR